MKRVFHALADGVNEQGVVHRVNSELQVDRAVATELVLQEQGVVGVAHWQAVEREAVKRVFHALADGVHEQGVVGRVNSELQGDDAVAAVLVEQVQGVVHSAHYEAVDLEAVKRVGAVLADRIQDTDLVVRVDGKLQRHDAVAAVVGLEPQCVEVLASQRVVHHEAVLGVALPFADGVHYVRQEGVVYLQVQEHHAVAGRHRGHL